MGNAYGHFRLVQAAPPHLKPAAASVATSSVTGLLASVNAPDYSATKGALNPFTKAMATGPIKRGVRIDTVVPAPDGRL